MTKRHCGTILDRYLASSAEGADSLPPVPRPSPWPAPPGSLPTSSCPTTSSAAACPAIVRGLCLRGATSRPSRVARLHIRRHTPSPPLSPRPHMEDVAHGGLAASSQRCVSRDRQHILVHGARSRLSPSCHRARSPGAVSSAGDHPLPLPAPRPPLRQRAPRLSARPLPVKGSVTSDGSHADLRPAAARLLSLPFLLPRSRGIGRRERTVRCVVFPPQSHLLWLPALANVP